ncbi:MAG TPA: TlpA disulfide reductase family protein [Fimbriimonas sp.]
MRQLQSILLLAGVALGVSTVHADGIGPGSPAPELDVKTWYKGTPVKTLDKNKTYVVEFWATWCGPCIQSIPHVTQLAKANKDVTFIGVSIWEDDKDGNIKAFIDKMGEKMDYNVGYSGNQTGMAQSWMTAAAQNGIPAAFIVKNGEIQWIGHPMSMDEPLAKVKAGTFDVKAFKAEFDKEAEATRVQMAARAELNAASKLIADGKYADAKTKLAELETKFPTMKPAIDNLRFNLLAKDNPAEWEVQAKAMAASKDAAKINALVNFAMSQTRAGGDVAMGTKAIDLALSSAEPNDLLTWYNGAVFYNQVKDYKKALGYAEKAVAAIPNSQYKDNASAKEAIEKLRADIAAKANG